MCLVGFEDTLLQHLMYMTLSSRCSLVTHAVTRVHCSLKPELAMGSDCICSSALRHLCSVVRSCLEPWTTHGFTENSQTCGLVSLQSSCGLVDWRTDELAAAAANSSCVLCALN